MYFKRIKILVDYCLSAVTLGSIVHTLCVMHTKWACVLFDIFLNALKKMFFIENFSLKKVIS